MADRPRQVFSRRWGLALFAAGLTVVFAGFAYDVLYAGIPYQDDPGPVLSQRYAANVAVAGQFYRAGFWIAVAGLAWLAVAVGLRITRRLRARRG